MTRGMVTAPQPEAVEAGLECLRAGGNGVDAAIATALVQTVVDPQMCGIAGFGTFHVYMPSRHVHTTLDFHGRSPLDVRPTCGSTWCCAKLRTGGASSSKAALTSSATAPSPPHARSLPSMWR